MAAKASKADLGPTTPAEKLRTKTTSSSGKTARTKSASEVATLLDVNRGTVKRWIDTGMPFVRKPEREEDSYDLDMADVVKWLQERAVAAAAAPPSEPLDGLAHPPGHETQEEAERRRAIALANIAEMDEEIKVGTVVPIDAVIDLVRDEYAAARAKLENVSSTLAGRTVRITDPAQVKALADSLVTEAVKCLVGDLSKLMADEDE